MRERRLIVVGGVASVVVIGTCVFQFARPLDGRYGGHFLDPLAVPSVFVLKEGTAFIQPDECEATPFGVYSRQDGVWVLKDSEGSEVDWLIKKTVFGFDLIDIHDRRTRYAFYGGWFLEAWRKVEGF